LISATIIFILSVYCAKAELKETKNLARATMCLIFGFIPTIASMVCNQEQRRLDIVGMDIFHNLNF
jgi:hypothetical protein